MKFARSTYLFSLLLFGSCTPVDVTVHRPKNLVFWLCSGTGLALFVHNYKVLYKAWYDQAYTTAEERAAHPLGVKNFFREYFCKFQGGKFGETSKGLTLLAIVCAAMSSGF